MIIRTLKEDETELLKEFLYEAIFIPEGVKPPDKSIIEFRIDYWGHLVEKVTVHRKGAMTFTLSCGVEIQI